jgi:hypothetical protein
VKTVGAALAVVNETLDWLLPTQGPVRKASFEEDWGLFGGFGEEEFTVGLPNPLKSYDAVVAAVFNAVKKGTKEDLGEANKLFLSTIDRQWSGLTEEQKAAALQKFADGFLQVGVTAAPKVETVFKGMGSGIAVATKKAADKQYGLGIDTSLDLADAEQIAFLAKSQAGYVRDQFGVRAESLSAKAREIVAAGLDEGLDRVALGKRLKDAVGEELGRTEGYFRMVSSVFVARARTWSTLRSFDEAGITAYQFDSVLDEVTSEVCRFMHGRVFPVAASLARMKEAETAEDPEAVVDLQPWPRIWKTPEGQKALMVKQGGQNIALGVIEESAKGKKDDVGSSKALMPHAAMAARGFSQPPLHGHCRSLLLPVFGAPAGRAETPGPDAPPALPPTSGKVLPYVGGATTPVWTPNTLPANLAEMVRPLPKGRDYETPGEMSQALTKLQAAIKAIQSAPPANDWDENSMLAPWGAVPFDVLGKVVPPKASVGGIQISAAKKKPAQDVPLSEIVGPKSAVHKPQLIALLSGDASLAPPGASYVTTPEQWLKWNADPNLIVMAKYQGKYHVIQNGNYASAVGGKAMPGHAANAFAIAHYSGAATMKAHVIDLDAKKPKTPPKPKTPLPAVPPPPAPPKVALGPPVAVGDAANILHEKFGEQGGSNAGGFYRGKDGVERYVKFYDQVDPATKRKVPNPLQAQVEHLSNSIYKDLGFASPESQLFQHNGSLQYSSKLFKGGQTFQQLGGVSKLSKEDAAAFMEGFVGDIMTANWDAAGMSLDNVMKLPDGRVVRIDNGGTFLFRAKNGKKDAVYLNKITEWEGFFNTGLNSSYASIAAKAGYSSADEMADLVKRGLDKVTALKQSAGSWSSYVDRVSPGIPAADRATIIDMLATRHELLLKKVEELSRPKPAPLPKLPGVFAYDPGQFSAVTPRPGLQPADLPESSRLLDVTKEFRAKVGNRYTPKTGPGGTPLDEWERTRDANARKAPLDTQRSVRAFGGSTYTSIRDSEESGAPDTNSRNIQKLFKACDHEQTTVFRGINLPDFVARKFIKAHLEQDTFGMGRVGADGKPSAATTSTSWHPDVAEGFMRGTFGKAPSGTNVQVVYKLRVKTGVGIEVLAVRSEREILLGTHARFRTTGLSWVKGTDRRQLVIEADEI